MDYDVNIQKIADAAYVIERPAGECLLADQATQFMSKKGMRMSFRRTAEDASSTVKLRDILPSDIGIIKREDGSVSKPFSSASIIVSAASDRNSVNSEVSNMSALKMVGMSVCGQGTEVATTFAALIAIQNSFKQVSIQSAANTTKPWGYSAKSPDFTARTIMTLLNKSNLVKSQLDTKNPQLEDFGRLAYDFVSKYGHDSRIKLASLSKDTSGYFNHDLKLSDKDQISEGMHFKVHDFSEIRYGPSFLPSALFNEASLKEIQGVHPDLLKVVARAREISSVHFEVVPGNGGLRSATEQKRLKHAGKSHANFGRHTVGYAIDLVPISKNGNPNFNDAKGYEGIRSAMETAANELGIPIQWGGNWKRLVDKPHFELDRQAYPVPGDKQLEEYVAQAAFR